MADPSTPGIIVNDDLPNEARCLVYEHVRDRLEKTDTHVPFGLHDVYVVWFAFVLGNWKALCSTTLPDQMYYEVTRNESKCETYIDSYKKWENVRIEDVRIIEGKS